MLIVVVACFSICWFPHEVYWVLKFPFPELSTFPADPYIFTVFHMLALSHACFNPIICCWMNSSVRHGFMCTFGRYHSFQKKIHDMKRLQYIISTLISFQKYSLLMFKIELQAISGYFEHVSPNALLSISGFLPGFNSNGLS